MPRTWGRVSQWRSWRLFQNRLGRTDGVSLEVDTWRAVLHDRMEHHVWYCSGNADVPGNYVMD